MKQTEQMRKLEKDISLLTQCMQRFWVWAFYPSPNVGAAPCALCEEYAGVGGARECGTCPIKEDGHALCRGTPYLERRRCLDGVYAGYIASSNGGPRPNGMTCEDAAAELVYLARLRDKLAVRLRSLEEMAEAADRKCSSRERAAEGRKRYEADLAQANAEAENVAAVRGGDIVTYHLTRRLGRLMEAFLFYVPPVSGDTYNRRELVRADKEAIWRELGLTEGEMLKGGDV